MLVTPVPTNEPVQTQPSPNFQYLPQKAYVQPFKPEVGVPQGQQPLTAAPQVALPAPAAPAQQGIGGIDMATLMGILGSAGAAFAYLKGHIVGKKGDKTAETTKEQSEQIVKGASVDQALAKQVFENMSDGGVGIKDAPEIKMENLVHNKEEAARNSK